MMYDPNPDNKDAYVMTFESAVLDRDHNDIDEELRERVQEQLRDLGSTVSYDK